MAILYRYGSIKPVPFKLTLSGVGVTGITLHSQDVQVTTGYATYQPEGLNCSEVGKGWYLWTPTSPSKTQAEAVILNINAFSGSPNEGSFDENSFVLLTGGDIAAFYDAI